MMYKWGVFVILTFVVACTSAGQERPTEPAEKTSQEPATATKTASAPASSGRMNYVVETARPKNEIKQTFPYDIDLKTADGTVVNSSEALRANGKPTVLLFWLTTCVPCRYEMKAIAEKYDQWQSEADFNLVAISTDFQKNYDAFVRRVKESGWKWKTYHDMNREFRLVMPGELNGLPQVFVLDKAGNIVFHKRKYRPGDEDVLFEKIKAAAK